MKQEKSKKSSQTKKSIPANNAVYGRMKLFLIAAIVLLYGKSIGYEFTLDDDLFIKNHPIVQKGIGHISDTFTRPTMEHFKGSNFVMYRPFTISAFAIQKELFGFNPSAFHFMNVLLYTLTIIVLFNLLKKLFPDWKPMILFAATLIFAVHPVHTEVVASIKSQDELLAGLFCLLSLTYAISFIDLKEKSYLAKSIIAFIPAVFCKESSVAFIAVYPLAFFLLKKLSFKETILRSLPYLSIGLFFLLTRSLVVNGIFSDNETTVVENILYGTKTVSEEIGTRLHILYYYMKLLFIPYPLSWDYSFNQIPITEMTDIFAILSAILYPAIIVTGLMMIKRKPEITFGLFFFLLLIAPTCNVFLLNGTTFAERFLYLPSLGIITALMSMLNTASIKNATILQPGKNIFSIGMAVIITLAALTFMRTDDWKNNFSLFESGVKNAPNSSRTNAGYGTELMNKAEKETDFSKRAELMQNAVSYLEKSIAIYPENAYSLYKVALIYSIKGDTARAISNYRKSCEAKPDYIFALNNLGGLYAAKQNYDSAFYYFNQSIKVEPSNEMTLTNIVVVAYLKGDYESVKFYGQRAKELNINSEKINNILFFIQNKSIK